MKYIIQIIAGTIFYFLFGWFVFDFLIGEYTELHTTQLPGFKKNPEAFSYSFLFASCLAYACLITYVLSYLIKVNSVKKGFYIAAVIGILVAMMTDFFWYASSNFYDTFSVIILDILAAGLCVGLLGAVISSISLFWKSSESKN